MRPGTAKRPAGLAISPLSFGSAFRSPAHAISPPSTTIAAFSTTCSPSKNPSSSNTVRTARSIVRRCPTRSSSVSARATSSSLITPAAAALTTLNTARTPQEHGNIAYFVWLEEFAAVTQMLRWGPGVTRRGSFFDNQTIDPRDYVKVPSVHRRLRERGAMSYVVEPEIFRKEAMTRMHAAEANYAGYFLPSTMGVQVRELLETRPWGERPAYLYAYWSGIDATAHIYGPSSRACATEAALFDLDLSRALADRPAA